MHEHRNEETYEILVKTFKNMRELFPVMAAINVEAAFNTLCSTIGMDLAKGDEEEFVRIMSDFGRAKKESRDFFKFREALDKERTKGPVSGAKEFIELIERALRDENGDEPRAN